MWTKFWCSQWPRNDTGPGPVFLDFFKNGFLVPHDPQFVGDFPNPQICAAQKDQEFQISSHSQLTELRDALDPTGALTLEMKLGGVTLGPGWRLREPKCLSCMERSQLDELQLQHLPMKLEAGAEREVQNLTMKSLQHALKRAGIHWLQDPEMTILLELLQQDLCHCDQTWAYFFLGLPHEVQTVSLKKCTLKHGPVQT